MYSTQEISTFLFIILIWVNVIWLILDSRPNAWVWFLIRKVLLVAALLGAVSFYW